MRLSRKTRCRIREAFGLRRVHRRFFLLTAGNIQHSTLNIEGKADYHPALRPWAPAADQDRINQMNRMPKAKDFIL